MALSMKQHAKYMTFCYYRALTRIFGVRKYCSGVEQPVTSELHLKDKSANEQDFREQRISDDVQAAIDLNEGSFLTKLALKPNQPENSKFLKVAIVGNPNAGKSTLVNCLIKRKIAPVSTKIHTTRKNLFAVITEGDTQIVLTDTPGLVREEIQKLREFEASLKIDPIKGSESADLICVVVDASDRWDNKCLTPSIQTLLQDHSDKTSILVLNKVDRVKHKTSLLEMVKHLTCGQVGGKRIPEYAPEKRENPLYSKTQLKKLMKKTQTIMKQVDTKVPEANKSYVVGPLQQSCGNIWDAKEEMSEKDINIEHNDIKHPDAGTYEGDSVKIFGTMSGERKINDFLSPEGQILTTDSPTDSLNLDSEEADKKAMLNRLFKKADQALLKKNLNDKGKKVLDSQCEMYDEESSAGEITKTEDFATLKSFDVSKKFDQDTFFKIYREKDVVYLKEQLSGWPHFQEVFMISAEENDGVDGVRSFLLQSAKVKDWEYHSSIIANEMPNTLVENFVKEQILEIVPGPTPYLARPVVQELHFNERVGMIIAVIQLKIKGAYYARLLQKFSQKIQKECNIALANLFYDPVSCIITIKETNQDNLEKAPKRNVKKVFQYKKEVLPDFQTFKEK